MPGRYTDEDFALAFWDKVDVRSTNECWEWRGARRQQGYGMIVRTRQWVRRSLLAHRVAYELAYGRPVPVGDFVCHRCDNPPCCNPYHLFLGGDLENQRDRRRKGRHGNEKNLPFAVKPPRGELNVKAKLSYEKADRIRSAYAAGASMKDLADKYGVTPGAIWFIVKNRHWVRQPQSA